MEEIKGKLSPDSEGRVDIKINGCRHDVVAKAPGRNSLCEGSGLRMGTKLGGTSDGAPGLMNDNLSVILQQPDTETTTDVAARIVPLLRQDRRGTTRGAGSHCT